jgi:hypothetical protein
MLPLLAALAPSLIQGAAGLFQSATSGAGAAEKNLENSITKNPLAQRSKSIDDYYQQALNRYQENPYQSAQYMAAQRNADRALASRLKLGQDLNSSLSMAGKADALYSDTLGQAGGQAEAQRNQRFGQYGQAAQLQNQQDKYIFDINEMTPYNRKLQLMQMKAQAANERKNAGIGMIGGALGNLALGGVTGAFKGLGGALGGSLGGALAPVDNAGFDSFISSDRGIGNLSGMGARLTQQEPYFGENSGNLYGYRGGDFLKTMYKGR